MLSGSRHLIIAVTVLTEVDAKQTSVAAIRYNTFCSSMCTFHFDDTHVERHRFTYAVVDRKSTERMSVQIFD
jgi:hypothetical protein